jgi:sugar transferase EpsL
MIRQTVKRFFDVILGAAALVVLSPLLIFIGLAIRWKMGRPVIFGQVRPGINGRPFTLYKYRTMMNQRMQDGLPLSDAERLPSFGRFLRTTSLDELPEFWNVLKGDLSLVGPRPLLMQYLDRYTPMQSRRHEVKPGITGWAQVNGRNAITWEEKFTLDVWYVDNRSFALDMKILAMTVWKVFGREGISAEGEATMPEFMGTASTRGKSQNA